jgi:hypothetical protein
MLARPKVNLDLPATTDHQGNPIIKDGNTSHLRYPAPRTIQARVSAQTVPRL